MTGPYAKRPSTAGAEERSENLRRQLATVPDGELEEKHWHKDFTPHPETGWSRGTIHRQVREYYVNGKPFLGAGSWNNLLERYHRFPMAADAGRFEDEMAALAKIAGSLAPSNSLSGKAVQNARTLYGMYAAGEIQHKVFKAFVLYQGYKLATPHVAKELGLQSGQTYAYIAQAKARLNLPRPEGPPAKRV